MSDAQSRLSVPHGANLLLFVIDGMTSLLIYCWLNVRRYISLQHLSCWIACTWSKLRKFWVKQIRNSTKCSYNGCCRYCHWSSSWLQQQNTRRRLLLSWSVVRNVKWRSCVMRWWKPLTSTATKFVNLSHWTVKRLMPSVNDISTSSR